MQNQDRDLAEGRRRWRAAGLLLLYGLFLLATNPLVTVFEDEAQMAATAHRSVAEILAFFTGSGSGMHDHPPLADLILHYWLRWTGEAFWALRVPSIVFCCLALWLVADIADRLWGKRWVALILAVAWPAGYFLGRPMGWYGLAMLGVAGLAWSYFSWRATGRSRFLAALGGFGVLLVYTNYFGWAFFGVLGLDLLWTRAGRRQILQFGATSAAVALAFLPLAAVLVEEVRSNVAAPAGWAVLLRGVYLAHSLVASEMAAPWTWPGAAALAAEAGLLWLALREAASRRALLWLGPPLVLGLATVIFNGPRLVLFGPWLLLCLTSLWTGRRARIAAALTGVAFALGWLGVVTGRYTGAHRYTEPWRQVTDQVLDQSRPGDVIVAAHPSFYFHLFYRVQWPGRRETPVTPVEAGGRLFVPLLAWEDVAARRPARLIHVRSVVLPWIVGPDQAVMRHASEQYRLVSESRYERDAAAELKNRFFPRAHQPEWRIQVLVWERAERKAADERR